MTGGTGAIKGLMETSFLDWPGRVAAVIFFSGCNFRCPFCHNAGLALGTEDAPDIPLEAVAGALKSRLGWLDGVVVSGGEPTLSKSLRPLLLIIRELGLPAKLDTNGYRPDVLKGLLDEGLISAVAMDVKAPPDDESYSRAAGVRVDSSRVKESVRLIINSRVEAYFRATVVPGIHDEPAVRAMAGALFGRPLTIQNFRPKGALDPEFAKKSPFGPDELARLEAAAAEAAAAARAGRRED